MKWGIIAVFLLLGFTVNGQVPNPYEPNAPLTCPYGLTCPQTPENNYDYSSGIDPNEREEPAIYDFESEDIYSQDDFDYESLYNDIYREDEDYQGDYNQQLELPEPNLDLYENNYDPGNENTGLYPDLRGTD